jgi:hypothetical protein
MNLDETLSSVSKQEAIQMAIEIVELEIYTQFLVIGVSPESFTKEQDVTRDDLGEMPLHSLPAESYAYTTIPRLINRRAVLKSKLKEIQNAGE